MPRWKAEAKKREEEKKTGAKKPQSSSVKNVNKKAQNSTFMGGGTSVKKTEKTYKAAKRPSAKARQVAEEQKRRRELEQHQNQKTYGDQKRATPRRTTTTSNNLTQHTTAAQRQKMGMPTTEDIRQGREHRRALANSVKDSVRRATSEENKSFMQRQKSGIQTEADRQYSEKLNQRRAEVAKNTGRAATKGVQDTLTGYGKTLADVDEMAKSNKNWTRAKASKMGISEDDTVGMAKVEAERQESIKQAQELRRDLAEKQDKRQAEFDERTKNAKGLEKAWYGAVESGTGMATDALVGALTGTGTAGSLASMAVRTYGTTRGQAEKEGATENEDRAYAVLQAAKEVGTELLFPGAGLAKKTYGNVGLSVADRVANKLTKGLTGNKADLVGAGVRLLGGTAEENAEELAGWGLDPVIKELAYGKNVRTRKAQNLLKQESDELRSNLKSADDARSVAAYLGSDRFLADNIAQYKDAGLSDKQAREVAEKMRDYLTASLTGDTDRMGDLEDEIVTTVAGGSLKAMIKDYDVGELMDTFASTSVLTLATGLPATATTAMKGARIRENLGSEGLRALSQTAINFEDDEASLKGQAARDRLDSGKDLTSTQVFDLAKAQAEQIQKDEKRVAAMSNMADNAIKSEKLVTPKIGFRENGSVAGDEIITMNYVNESNNATEIISDLLKEEGSESLTDTEVQTGSRAIAGFKTGAFTVNDANALNYTNTTVRSAFEEATGVNLSQYVVKRNGQVDIPATNAATKDALFAMAADNFVKTAQAETANWMDSVKGDVVTQVTERMGAQGSLALQQALDDVDERDRSTYMMNANAADMMYQTARNMGTEWDSVKAEARRMFPDISETKLEAMYNAGLRDRADAANGAIGQQVRMGETMSLQNEPSEPKGKVFVDTTATPKGTVVRTFSEIASNLGVDIHLVDDLKTSTGGQANGQYVNGAIYINMNSDFESNIGYIFMHEVTHHLKQYAPEQFNELENLVREKWFGYNPEQMQNEIAKKIDLYKRNGQTLSEEEALEEIIADAAHEFINDRNFADQVAEQNPDIAKAILNGIRNALRMLRRLFASGSIDDETHMNSLFSQLNILDEAEKLWLNAYTQAVQNKAINAVNTWQDEVNEQQSLSISETTDSAYMQAVESDDMETAQRMVDEAAEQAGYNIKAYHGTSEDFNKFSRAKWGKEHNGYLEYGAGFYFTPSEEEADRWAKRGRSGYAGKETKVMSVYLSSDRAIKADDPIPGGSKVLQNMGLGEADANFIANRTYRFINYLLEDKGFDNVEVQDELKYLGFDAVDATYGEWIGKPEGQFVVFDPEQIKSADPVTYDDNGNVIPLSERFNQENEDIRFSLSEPVERVKDLIAVHNLKPDDIRNTFELGGFPMPSIAITKDSMGHDMYGDISLLFGSDTIDPKFFRSNQVFGGDAYTPTFPATQYKPNEDIVEKFRDIYYDNAKTLGYDAMRPFYELAEDAENALNINGGEQGLIDRYKNDIRAMRTFLKINGKDVEDVVKRTEDTISETEQKLRQYFIDTLGEDAIREFEGESIPHGKAMMDHRKNWTYDHSDEIKSAYKDFLNREFSFSDEEISNVLDNMSLFETMKLVRNALNYLNNGPTTVKEEVDRAATDKAIEDAAHELGYEEWIDGLLTGIEEKRGIRNDKEFFTRNGNRRSWDTLHDDITLENVVKAMRSELAAGGNGFLWKNPKGAAQKQYKSLDEIHADEDRLQQLPEEEYKALEQAATQKLSDVLSDVVDNNPGRFMNSFGAVLDTGEYIAEILNETRDKATMQRKLKKDYSLDVSDEQMDRIAEAIDEIANIPTGYFEAKPRRAVGFDEVKAAIIPQNIDEDIKAGLSERGISSYEYDPDVEGDRTAKVNEAADAQNLRFSITDSDGNNLSDGQATFFADSKMVDAEGKLKPMYHGTQNEFYEFDITKAYPGTLGRGFYFSDSDSHAGVYGRTNKYYLNLVNPLMSGTNTITKDQLHRFVSELAEDEDYGLENYGYGATVDSVVDSIWGKTDFAMLRDLNLTAVGDFAEALKIFNRVNDTDYDGIITDTETIAFYPQQVKSVDNLNPTLSKDTRYSITDSDGKELSDGQVEYFKNSQARDEQGRLVPVYHTTNHGGFTVFDPMRSDDHRSLFFASNWDVSQTYGNYANSRFYQFDINNLDDVEKYLDAYGPDFYVLTKDEFKRAGGYEADFVDFENEGPQYRFDAIQKKWKSSNRASETRTFLFKSYIEDVENGDIDPDDYVVIVGVPDYSPDNRSYSDTWILANSPNELVSELKNHFLAQQNTYSGASTVGTQHGYYQCYLNLENPLIIDAQGQNWNDISDPNAVKFWIRKLIGSDRKPNGLYGVMFDGPLGEYREGTPEELSDLYNGSISGLINKYDISIGANSFTIDRNTGEQIYGESSGNTRYWAERAEAEGHDGVIFRNLLDIGGKSEFDGLDEYSDIYIAFSSNQVKDINNENPTENPDIRYSITDDDEAMSHMAHDYAYDNSYEALAHYEEMIAADEADEAVYQKAKNYIAKDVDEFYAGLTRYADGMRFDDPVLEEGRTRMAKSKQDFFNSNKAKWNDRWLTDGEVLDIKSVEKAVRDLVTGTMLNSNTNRKYSQETVKKTLIDMRLAYFYAKQGRTDIADALLWHSAHRMIDGVEFYADDSTFEEYKGLRDYLKNTRIQLGEEYWSDVDYAAFRKENYGRLNLVKGETNVDKIYAELEEMFPGLFDSETYDNAPDQLMHMAEVLDSVQPYAEAYSSEYCAEWATDIASDLLDIMQSGKELQSTADKYKKRYDEKAKAMKARHAEAMLKVRQQRDEGIKRERVKFKEYVERKKEKQAHNKYFDSIQKSHKKLTDRLLSNTADSNIPQQYKKELAKLLAAFDLQTVGSKKVEARRGVQGQKTIKMAAIKTALNNIESRSGEFHVSDAITDIIDELLGKDVGNGNNRGIEGLTIDELNSSELARIDKLLKALVHEFNTYKTVKVQAKRRQTADIGKAQVNSSLEHAQIFGQRKDYQNITGVLDKIVNMGEMTPAYMFRMLDPNNEGIGLMWKEIRRSFDRYVRNQNQLNDWMDEIIGEYHQKGILWNKYGSGELSNWRSTNYQQTFVLTNGAVTLTPAQMMSLYCLSKRNQAYGHMVGAGIVVAPVSFQAKIMSDVKKKADMSLPVILTDADIKHIVSKLTPDQIKVADKLQELMATKMAAWGNEASMNVLGIELFGEPDYFPIKSDKAALEKDLDADQFANAIRSFGFTKAVQPGARNAIMIDDIFDVVAEHCNNMNLYNSYSEAMNDFMKVYNYRDFREDGREYTVQQAIAHAYSRKATTYIMQFMKDLNGNVSGRSDAIENAYNTALGNAKKAAVFANLRVAAQQPTAIVRAFAEIDPKYIKGIRVGQGDMKEMMEHCPIALWKSWGYYDINMGKSIEDIMMNNGKWLEDKATDLYGALDNVTWTAIWQMVKAETRDKHPELKEGTDEFFEHCNERMSEIVDFTQVVDSPMHRSHDMRSKNMITKLATSFMAEPTLTFNMVKDGMRRAYEEYEAGSTKKAAGILQRTFNVFIIQAGTLAAFAAAIDALRKKKPDKDDEDDRFLHLWWVNALENFKDNLKLWNNIYFVKDIASMFEGWDNNNLALQGWKNLATGWNQLTGNGYVKSSKAWYENMAYGLGYLSGVPVKTIMTGISNFTNMFGVTLPGVEMITEELDALPDAFKKDDAEIEPESMAGKFISIALSDDDKSVMDKVAEKMGYKPIGSNAVAADKNETKSDSKETKESSADIEKQLEEYRETLSDTLSEDQKDKLVKQYKKTLEKEAVTEAAMSEDFDVQAHIAEAQANFDYEMEKRSIKAAEMAAGKTGRQRDEALWDVIAEGYTKSVDSGNMATIQRMREEFAKQGGDTEWFDAKIADKMKSAYKKTIYSSDEIVPGASLRQETMYNFMTEHGVSETEISDIVYHSYVARDLKAAMRIGNEDYIMDELVPLVAAGLSREDYEKLYKYRNMGAKTYDGKYTDPKYTKTTGTFVWPTEGVITSHFGWRNAPTAGASSNHPAIDIGAPSGTTVVAADGGVVITAGANGGYGNSVGIKHANGMVTYYNHLSAWNVKVGDQVAQGQPIANVGSTGISTGPHLDFKILDADGNPVDPEKYLNKRS